MKKILINFCACLSISGLAFQPVDINLASSEQIAALPGIGKRVADNVLIARNKHGPIRSESDLLRVPGMTEKKIVALKGKLVFSLPQPVGSISSKAIKRKISGSKSSLLARPENDNKLAISRARPEALIDLVSLERKVLAIAGLSSDLETSLAHRARKAKYLPHLQLYSDAEHGVLTSDKKAVNNSDFTQSRSGFDFEVGIKLIFDLPDLVFNKEELDIANLALKRLDYREKIIAKLHKFYFRYQEISKQAQVPSTEAEQEKIKQELSEISAELDSLSQGEFSRFREARQGVQ